MQVRDLIELLQTFDPYDHVKIEIEIKNGYPRVGEPETIAHKDILISTKPYSERRCVVIKCRE